MIFLNVCFIIFYWEFYYLIIQPFFILLMKAWKWSFGFFTHMLPSPKFFSNISRPKFVFEMLSAKCDFKMSQYVWIPCTISTFINLSWFLFEGRASKKILLIFKFESLFKVLSCSNDRLVKYLGKKYSLLKTQNCVKSTIFYLATKSSKKISMQSDSISTETEIKEWLHLDHCIADLIDVEFSIFLWSIETVALWAKIPTEIVMKLEALILPYFELILIITIYLRSRIKTHTS